VVTCLYVGIETYGFLHDGAVLRLFLLTCIH
jgi:hypothetical protein